MPDTFIIYGPPGTGKTTRLIGILSRELEIYSPHEVAFVSFTKKGVEEGLSRATERFNLDEKNFPYFKTLHSLTFHQGGYRKRNVLGKNEYRKFSQALGMHFTGYYTEDFFHNDDKYLFHEILSRNNKKQAQKLEMELDDKKRKFVAHNYRRFKNQIGKIDFTDMLENYLLSGDPLPVKVAIVDEAQDLTTLQWEVVNFAFSNCDKVFIAGDDLQAIYEYSGADTDYFLHLTGKNETVLNQSYRLPKKIHTLANFISDQVSNKVIKNFYPRKEEGKIESCASLKEINFNYDGSWLLLARNNRILERYTEFFSQDGTLYRYKGENFYRESEVNLIKLFERLRKNLATRTHEDDINLMRTLKDRVDYNEPWYMNFNWPLKKIDFYRNVFKNKTHTFEYETKINISTIHGAKGGEADNVVLFLDVSRAVGNAIETNLDSELRCLYVAITRARKNLYLILSETQFSYEKLLKGFL